MELIDEGTATQFEQTAPVYEGGSAPHCERCGKPMMPAAFEHAEGASIPLRCFVRRLRNGRFLAECIDLDLGTEADTVEGAIEGLGDAIVGYLMVVLEEVETEQEAPEAVLRPSPIWHRIRYHLDLLAYRIARTFKSGKPEPRRFYRAPYGLSASQCHP